MVHFINHFIGVMQEIFPHHMAINIFLVVLDLSLMGYLLFVLGVFSNKKALEGDFIKNAGMMVKGYKPNDERRLR